MPRNFVRQGGAPEWLLNPGLTRADLMISASLDTPRGAMQWWWFSNARRWPAP